jgi:hypothetical protein
MAHDGLTQQPCDLESNEFLVGEVPAEPHRREVTPAKFPEQKYHTYNVMDRHRSDANSDPDPTSILGIKIRIPPQVTQKNDFYSQQCQSTLSYVSRHVKGIIIFNNKVILLNLLNSNRIRSNDADPTGSGSKSTTLHTSP